VRSRIITGALLVLALIAGLVASLGTTSTAQANTAPIVWLVPHQDDEVLSYAADMRAHFQATAPRPAIAVLLTDGGSSSVCDYDKTTAGITATERTNCTLQRDAEFRASIDKIEGATGVQVTVDIRADRAQDGSLSIAYVRQVMDEYQALYPGVSFKGYSYKESIHCDTCAGATTPGHGHPDHDAIGEAMRDEWEESGKTLDVRFYIKPSLWSYWPGFDNGTVGDIGFWSDRKDLNAALNAYGPNAPDEALSNAPTGLGQKSSSIFCEQFAGTQANPTSLWSGKSCTNPDDAYNVGKPGGADNYIHLPGK
jgi:LmbE family N-acetylglucosaminyl deacetylase